MPTTSEPLTVHNQRHPVRFPPSQSRLGAFAIVVRPSRFLGESLSIAKAKRVDYAAVSRRRFADRSDIHAALSAQQIIGRPGAETIALHKLPI
jgi:hypothetical protein